MEWLSDLFGEVVEYKKRDQQLDIASEKTDQLNLMADIEAMRNQLFEPEFDAQDIAEEKVGVRSNTQIPTMAIYAVGAVLVALVLRGL